jgi:hypothetical protein
MPLLPRPSLVNKRRSIQCYCYRVVFATQKPEDTEAVTFADSLNKTYSKCSVQRVTLTAHIELIVLRCSHSLCGEQLYCARFRH